MYTRSMAFYDALYRDKDYAREAEIVKATILAHRRSDGRRLLDVACGTGRHLEYLQRDFEAMGLDINGEMLDIARKRCPDLDFVQGDMAAFDLGRQFDAVTCLFSAIGAMQTVEGLNAAVRVMARHIAPGGVLVIEPWLLPEDYRVGHLFLQCVDTPEGKIVRGSTSKLNGRIAHIETRYMIVTPEGVETFAEDLDLGLFSAEEYRAAMALAGLEVTFDAEGLTGRGLWIGCRA